MTNNDDKNLEDIANAPTFNGLDLKEKKRVLIILSNKLKHNEIPEEIKSDAGLSLEYTTKMYHNQKIAFEDVLTKKGYEKVTDVPRDYQGNIALLTALGTLIMLGKPRPNNRGFTMARIYDIKNSVKNKQAYLEEDLEIKKRGKIRIPNFTSDQQCNMTTSNIQGLCINPHGVDGDVDAEKRDHLDSIFGVHGSVISMGTRTQNELLGPKKPVLPNSKDTENNPYKA